MSPATGPRHSAAVLFLALLSSCVHLQGTDSAAVLPAWISSPLEGSPVLGQNFSITCEGHSTFPESSVMYWLANDSFVRTLYSSGAVREAETMALQTKFECIILDPASVARKTITWVPRRVQMEEDTEGSGVHQDP